MAYILFVYLASFSVSTGMAVTQARFNNGTACNEAAATVEAKFKSLATQVRTVCVPEGSRQ